MPVLLTLGLLACPSAAAAQSPAAARPRRHFVTVSYDWHHTQPLHFAEYPLAELLGRDVASAPAGEAYDYRTRDGAAFVDVLEFGRRQQGASITLYPLGMGRGPTLALRASRETLPVVRLAVSGQAPLSAYALTDARAVDGAAGLYVADRSAGWGLGSHAFVLGGYGRITSSPGEGRRYFAEGGGGLTSGPIGVDLAVKFAWNRLSSPVEHRFLTVPITLRGTLTF
ncbi:MAG TPA: hypothetical protein VE379_05575 [Vicinamibacterales bacterium]|nr:hypothetical protein [Vicinamibacterales bacterium]